jgi:hypothetical protein
VSKALDKSKNIPIVYSPLSIALVILSKSSIIAYIFVLANERQLRSDKRPRSSRGIHPEQI